MKGTFTRDAFEEVSSSSRSSTGSFTHAAEQSYSATGKVDPLVDPSQGGVIRLSLRRFMEINGYLFLSNGMPMLTELSLDTTSSMGRNVDIAFEALPDSYELVKKVLARYDLQMINGIFQDTEDRILMLRSMAEMDKKIAQQLTLMVPDRNGYDPTEDPDYALFGSAYLTRCDISKFGLKTYHFTATDAPFRGFADKANLIRVYGKKVFEKCQENGFDIAAKDEFSTEDIVRDLLKTTHAFVFIVKGESAASGWKKLYGRDRVIILPDMHYLPQAQAAVIGLTEGTLDLQNIEKFLVEDGKMSTSNAQTLIRAVSGIPIGAQAMLPNFNKIPLAGSYFKSKEDINPISAAEVKKMKKEVKTEEWL